jgi:hypothetical protein
MCIFTRKGLMAKRIHFPVLGEVYGEYVVCSEENLKVHNKIAFKVKCSCGKECIIPAKDLKSGIRKRCKSCASRITLANKPFVKKDYSREDYLRTYLNRVEEGAEKRDIQFSLTLDYVIDLLEKQEYKCALSGLNIDVLSRSGSEDFVASIDRINNDLGYYEGNIQWVHKDINRMKHIFSQDYFLFICDKVSKYRKLETN